MVDITDLADRSSRRWHLDKVLFRTDIGQEETKNPKPKQLQQIGPKKPLPIAKDDPKRTQESGETNHDSGEGKDEKHALHMGKHVCLTCVLIVVLNC